MIIPFLKKIDDVEEPDNIEDFLMHLVAYIGVKDEDGEDCFYFRVITPKKLAKVYSNNSDTLLRAIFIVNGSNMEENINYIAGEINKILLGCARDTWEETALAINYYLNWEYYDPKKGICDFYKNSRNLIE